MELLLKPKLKDSTIKIMNQNKIDDIKRENFINKCILLVNENTSLKSKVQHLELTLSNFSKVQKSFNMLLGNQL